jgi:branched-subunit amino acid transport protein
VNGWIVVGAAGIVTYLLRITPVTLLSRHDTPPWMDRASGLMVPVAFAALAAAATVAGLPGPTDRLAPALIARLSAIVVTAVVAHRFRSAGTAVAAGVIVFATLNLSLGR